MRLRRNPSTKRRLTRAVGTYLNFEAISKLAKRALRSAKRAPAHVKALPVVAGVGVAGAVAARKRRQREPAPAS